MSMLFNHGRRHELCDRNPIQWVRQSAKRRSAPDVLSSSEVQKLLADLRLREQTLVLLAVTTGLRKGELFALKWKDVDFENRQLSVTRSIVQHVVGACKTESSQKPVPLHDGLITALRGWHLHTPTAAQRVGCSPVPRIMGADRIGHNSSCGTTFFLLHEGWASQNESAGTLFVTPIRRFFEPRAQS